MANERWRTDGKYPNAADPRVRDGVTTILLIRGYFVRPLIPRGYSSPYSQGLFRPEAVKKLTDVYIQ
jgi:hypothetical protein